VSNGAKRNILWDDQGLIKELFFHWNNAPVPPADIIQTWMAVNKIQLLQHPPYLLDLAPADYFLFWRVKEKLAGIFLTPKSLNKIWEEVIQNIDIDEFVIAFRVVVRPLQQVHMEQDCTRQEILRNKYPANYDRSNFNYVFQFDFEFTMYIPYTNA
jgi:hypothetical protein